MIGRNPLGNSCTDKPPFRWMGNVMREAAVRGLTQGVGYNLYEYEFAEISATGTGAALAVPTGSFNADAGMATHATGFIAIRAVPASAP